MPFFVENRPAQGVAHTQFAYRALKAKITPSIMIASAIYLVFCAIYILVSGLNNNNPALSIIHVGSAVSLLVFWRNINWGIGRYDTFGAALLLFYAMYKLQAALDMAVYGARIEDILITVPLPENLTLLFLKSEALNHFGVLLLVAVWRRVVGAHIESFSFLNNYRDVNRQLPKLIYVAALVIQIFTRIAKQDFGALAQLSSLTYQFGVVSVFFIASMQRSRYQQIMTAILLAIPLVLLSIGGGTKEAMIFPLIPAVLIAWFRFRSISFKLVAIIIGCIFLAYSQLYVKYVRDQTWGQYGASYSEAQLLEGFQKNLQHVTLADGMDSISSRINMTISRAITVAIADARGFEPNNIFTPIPASLVPRLFWPNKPILMPGAQHTLRIRNQHIDVSKAGSSTAAGFFNELYLGGGYVGWALGIVLYAILLGKIQCYTWRNMKGFGHLALSFLTVYWALRFEEKAVAYAYTGLFFSFSFLVLVTLAASIVRRRSR